MTLPDQPAVPDTRPPVSVEDALLVMAEIVSGRMTGPGTLALVEEVLRHREAAVRAESAAALQKARDHISDLEEFLDTARLNREFDRAALREVTAEVGALREIQRAAVKHSIAVLAQSSNADESQDERHADESFATFEALTAALQRASEYRPAAPPAQEEGRA
jgi:hypothetical protein